MLPGLNRCRRPKSVCLYVFTAVMTLVEYFVKAGQMVPTPFMDKYRAVSVQQYLSGSNHSNVRPRTVKNRCRPAVDAPDWESVDAGEPQRWQPVSANSRDAFVFSAFFDTRWMPSGRVIIIGIASEYEQGGARRRYCRVWLEEDDTPWTVVADFRFVPGAPHRKYATVMYTCHVTYKKSSRTPYAVSLVDDVCQTRASNLLHVLYNDPGAPPEVDFTVCFSVLHSGFNNSHQLLETIEANRMFGAERFVIYDYETGSSVRRTLSRYTENGVGVVVPWNSLPVKSFAQWRLKVAGEESEVHYFGQVAASNDCLYRNLFRSTFILFADLDEIVVPRGTSESWMAVLEAATAQWAHSHTNHGFPGAYSVRSSFFRPDVHVRPKCVSGTTCQRPLLSLSTLTREDYIYPHDKRSKYFVWSKATVMVGIHYPREMVRPGWVSRLYLRPEEALVHHYRADSAFDHFPNLTSVERVPDERMLYFADVLLRRTAELHTAYVRDL